MLPLRERKVIVVLINSILITVCLESYRYYHAVILLYSAAASKE